MKNVVFCERDSSGTTERTTRSGGREGDGADSPTRASGAPNRTSGAMVRASEAARPNYFAEILNLSVNNVIFALKASF
jgi:hypothetical protein